MGVKDVVGSIIELSGWQGSNLRPPGRFGCESVCG
jgi:hypothetical protein